jgi:hypothetical protein
VKDMDILEMLPFIKPEYVGYGLIGIGLLMVVQRIILPLMGQYIDWQVRNYIQTSIVSLIFIIGGIKMLGKKRVEELEEEVEDEE